MPGTTAGQHKQLAPTWKRRMDWKQRHDVGSRRNSRCWWNERTPGLKPGGLLLGVRRRNGRVRKRRRKLHSALNGVMPASRIRQRPEVLLGHSKKYRDRISPPKLNAQRTEAMNVRHFSYCPGNSSLKRAYASASIARSRYD